ncbi:sialidase family protein [Thiohalobacter thiocyanaticus]|nr:sialidase family protein [Thiohalobacter thiocyanaticus]
MAMLAVVIPSYAASPQISVASAAFDSEGVLWVISPRDGHIWLRRSRDFGSSFTPAVRLTPEPEAIVADGENKPKLRVTEDGGVYVSYTRARDKPYTGDIRLIRSHDGGLDFEPPVTVNDNRDQISHRFDALQAAGDGRLWLAWLDKRDRAAAQQRGEHYAGAALYAAASSNGGASIQPNVKLADHTCECCRVAMALDTDDTPVVFWRHIFGRNTRDHAMLRLDGKSEPVRIGSEGWEIDACPHHGPALAIGPDGLYHFAWYTQAQGQATLHYLRSRDRGENFSAAMQFGDARAQPGHPDVISLGDRVVLVWKEFDGMRSAVMTRVSTDAGRSWGPSRPVAYSQGPSDHPVLLAYRERVFLSWASLEEGYRLFEIDFEGV